MHTKGRGRGRLALSCAALAVVFTTLAGAGPLTGPANFGVGSSPYGIATGDLNGDGKLDLAVANRGSNTVSVLLGNGSGSFGASAGFAVGSAPEDVAIADVNGDGKRDLAVANFASQDVSILLGNGNGTFGAATSFASPSGPPLSVPPSGPNPTSLAFADVNLDGKQDVLTVNEGTGDMGILLGNGLGDFTNGGRVAAAFGGSDIAVADFNADGKPDVAISDRGGPAQLEVLLGNGTGFNPRTTYGVGSSPYGVAVGDANGDGKTDIFVANASSSSISVLLGNGAGGFAPRGPYGAPAVPEGIAAGDIDGDGKLDLVAGARGTGPTGPATVVLKGNGDGTFGAAQRIGAGNWPHKVAIGDFDGGGNDIAVVNRNSNNVSVYLQVIDTAPPVTTASLAGTAGTNGWFKSSVTVTLAVTDMSGVASTEYRVDGGSFAPYTAPFPVSGDGTHTVEYRSTDVLGFAETTKSTQVKIDAAVPSTSSSLAGTLGTNGWYKSAVTVTLTPADATSGVGSTQYRIDGGAFQAYTTPFSVSANGTHTVEFQATDAAGNQETLTSTTVKVDTVAPSTTSAPAGPLGTNGWYRGPVIVTLTPTDSTSGVASTKYRIDGGSFQTYSAPFPVAGDGVHTVEFTATDAAGNVETQKSTVIKIDTTNPTTTSSLGGTLGSGGWHVSAVTVTLTPTDATSGVGSTQVRVDGGPFQSYTSPLSVSGEGTHTVEFQSTDAAGNTEGLKSTSFKIDTVAPSTGHAFAGLLGSNGWYRGNVTTTLSSSDATSGLISTQVRIDGGPFHLYTGPFGLSTQGAHTIEFQALDAAGNRETLQSASFKIDSIAPATTSSLAGTLGSNDWYRSSVTVTLAATDAVSGVATSEASVDGGVFEPYIGPFSVSGQGAHTVEFRSTDAAANTEELKSTSFKIDSIAPVTTPDENGPLGDGGFYVGDVTVGLTAEDAGSGVDSTEFRLDGDPFAAYASPFTVSGDGERTYAFRSTDLAGNVESTVTESLAIDTIDPTLTVPAPVSATTDGGATAFVSDATLGTATGSDANGVTITRSGVPAGNVFPFGTTTVTWTATDGAGHSVSGDQLVTVTDDDDPTIAAPADVTTTTDPGEAFASGVSLGSPVTDDNIAISNIANDAPAQFPFGTTVVTWTVTDTSGNTASATQEVEVVDEEPPAILAPAPLFAAADPGLATATIPFLGTPIVSDNVAVDEVANDAPAVFPLGPTTVIWTATDTSGNSSTATQVVTVFDSEPPTIAAPADVAATTDPGEAFASGVVLGAPVAADNVGVATVTSDAPAQFPVGTTTVTWTATDAAGNSETDTQQVTVTDDEPPAIAAPAELTLGSGPAAAVFLGDLALGSATASDNVPGVVVSRSPLPIGNLFPIGSTEIVYTATDAAGNTASDSQTVTVVDDADPVLTVPANISADATGTAGAAVFFTVSATDNGSTPSIECTFASGSTFPIGTTTNTCTATDAALNEASASFTVTVAGTEALLDVLHDAVAGLSLSRSLQAKIDAATAAHARGNRPATCGPLGAFVNEVRAQTPKKITTAQSAMLLSIEATIARLVGCSAA